MAAIEPRLFGWEDVEARSDLERFYLVRDHLPDGQLVPYLEEMRGRGRDEYPVRGLWNLVLAGVVFQHPSLESLRRELRRNPALLQACGFAVLPVQNKPALRLVKGADGAVQVERDAAEEAHWGVPETWNMTRLLGNVIELEACLGLVSGMIVERRESLMTVLPDFGQHLGDDGKAIDSHSTGRVDRARGQTADPDAAWGKHETRGVAGRTGKPWTKIKTWFGYGLHLIADTQYEIPVAMALTPASAAEQVQWRALVTETFAETPELAERCRDFSADRGLDSAETKALLWDDYAIRPLIDTRERWREEKAPPDDDPAKPITRPRYPERIDTLVYTEKGSMHGICPASGVPRDLAFQGFEADRDTLKYRCPAAAYGLDGAGREACSRSGGVAPGDDGRIVRIKLDEQDRRIFTPTPHGSPRWQRGYHRRSALERINNRIDNSFGFERHFIRGQAKMQTRVGLALAVMMAMALGHVKAGRIGQMRSLVRPIAASG